MTEGRLKGLDEILDTLRQHKAELAERYGVREIAVFGSYACGEAGPPSDVDLMVHLEKPIGFRFFELWDHLESILRMEVDLLTPGSFRRKPRLWEHVKEDLTYV